MDFVFSRVSLRAQQTYEVIHCATRSWLVLPAGLASYDRLGQEIAMARFRQQSISFDVTSLGELMGDGRLYEPFTHSQQQTFSNIADTYMKRKHDLPNGAFLPNLPERKS